MPFWYHIPVPVISDSSSQAVRLAKWLVKDHEEVHAGTPLAILESPKGRFVVLANGDGFIRERLFPVGAELQTGTPIATVNADGEKIPYGKPYSRAERIEGVE
jgi:pyruvate/2-oxoglutarate dehydrogenase complex dihydrolipoamide acyltransferase (E2) component